ncbi:N-acyl homoserine lactonase family protein [Oleispirillum naphthae]|uniref:N-acyl homoserine lactonase family protein n=1 Tax=Oleispirillum naphthae TaxID=2838853 RepID=UPI0030826560
MTDRPPQYELYAIRYATRDARRADHFIGGDPHDGPMPMDYFLWVAIGAEKTVVIDTGFTKEVAAQRKRTFLRDPIEVLPQLGVAPAEVSDVVITHMHYDHAGNLERFPKACFHIQEKEVQFATGRYMRYHNISHSFEPDDVCDLVRLNFKARVAMYDSPADLAPGIRLHPAGGHSLGLQFVSVYTARGWVVLASDVSHFYENMEAGRPFRTAVHIGEMMEGFDALYRVAPSPQHIVPGHDPLVMSRYPAARPDLEGIAVSLHASPH